MAWALHCVRQQFGPEEYGMPGNYVAGANIDGFRRVAEAMLALGLI